jgi:hypothetical protein
MCSAALQPPLSPNLARFSPTVPGATERNNGRLEMALQCEKRCLLPLLKSQRFRNEVVSKSLYQFMGFCSASLAWHWHGRARKEEREEEKKGTKLGIDFRYIFGAKQYFLLRMFL